MARTKNLGFLGAAERVLSEAGEPLHYGEITRRALASGWVVTSGKTPDATLNAQIASNIKREGDRSIFVRVHPGVFGLRQWLDRGHLDESTIPRAGRPLVPHYPLYARVRDVLPVWAGAPRGAITGMRAAIGEHRGTPQSQVGWSASFARSTCFDAPPATAAARSTCFGRCRNASTAVGRPPASTGSASTAVGRPPASIGSPSTATGRPWTSKASFATSVQVMVSGPPMAAVRRR